MNVIWDTDDFVPQVSFIDREMLEMNSVDKGQMSVVDGQQRLTTNYKAYSNSDDFRNIVLDVARGRFLLVEGAFTRSQIPVGMLLNKDDAVFYDYLTKNNMMKDPTFMTVLVQCRSKLGATITRLIKQKIYRKMSKLSGLKSLIMLEVE